MKNNKIIIIILTAVLCLMLAVGAFLIFSPDETKPADSQNASSAQSEASSSESVSSSEPADNGITLEITSPTKSQTNVTEESFTFTGTSDPEKPLLLNGTEIKRETDGIFSHTVTLNVGKNTFTFSHKDKTLTYTVNYRYVIMNYFSPEKAQIYSSGSTFIAVAYARTGSTVTATFNGETINLISNPTAEDNENTFIPYTGQFTLPRDNYSDLNLGKIKFAASFGGKSESFYSGNITCKRPDFIVDYDPNATPLGGNYINVGSGKIAEVIAYQAETFAPGSTNDWSLPTYNYLPKGTVDYSAQGYVYYKDEKEYAVLRCGRQVYTKRKDIPYTEKIPVIKEYAGTLPDHNEIELVSFENGGSHSRLVLGTMWKAPFYFDILPQAYQNPSKQNFKVDNVTYNYIDITFCYATVMTGQIVIPEDNPLFSSGEIKKNKSDYTLRLFLKKQGAFYGWDAYYNDQNQLVFEFLNPKKLNAANSAYGIDLTGAKIFIDVGHGGKDPGAAGFSAYQTEAFRNLVLAEKIKAQLETLGATVYMNRTGDTTSSADEKIKMLKSIKPDFCIAIHHNSSTSSRANGFDSYYYNAFSKKAADFIYTNTVNTGLYKNNNLGWHYYFMARTTNCPVVLTENGYMSNASDYNNITNDAVNNAKADAIVKGIAQYFSSIQ